MDEQAQGATRTVEANGGWMRLRTNDAAWRVHCTRPGWRDRVCRFTAETRESRAFRLYSPRVSALPVPLSCRHWSASGGRLFASSILHVWTSLTHCDLCMDL